MIVGMDLREYLQKKRISKEEFAELCFCTPTYIQRISIGDCIPSLQMQARIHKNSNGLVRRFIKNKIDGGIEVVNFYESKEKRLTRI